MIQISWTAKKSNETVLWEIITTKSLINQLCERHQIIFDHVMRREILEILSIETIVVKCIKGEQGEADLRGGGRGGGSSSGGKAHDSWWGGPRFDSRCGRPLPTGWVGVSIMWPAETEVMVSQLCLMCGSM